MFANKIICIGIVFSLFYWSIETNNTNCSPVVWNTISQNGKNYTINTYFLTNWYQAHRYCVLHGMQLFAPENDVEFFNVIDYLKNNGYSKTHFWIAGTDNGFEGQFYWISTGKPMTLSRAAWVINQPDGNEHCVHLWGGRDLLLNDSPCNLVDKYFICESSREL